LAAPKFHQLFKVKVKGIVVVHSTMQAALHVAKQAELTRQEMELDNYHPTKRASQGPGVGGSASDNQEHADAFWNKVKHTQQLNFHPEEAEDTNLHILVNDARLHFAREARMVKNKLTLFVKGTKCIIHPKSPRKVAWDIFVAAFIMYSVLLVPFKLGFSVENETLDVIDIFVDLIFLFDMILSFNQAYFDTDKAVYVIDRCLIAKHYSKTWFSIDFFSTFPIYRVARAFMGDDADATRSFQLIRSLRLVRLLKLARLLKLKKLSRFMREAEINPGVLRMIGLISRILFVAHLFACLWHGVGVESLNQTGQAWIIEFGAISETMFGKYIMALHFTVATMMAVGYGDIYATTTLERGFSIITQIVGALVFGWILATVAVFYESADPRTAEIIRRTKKLKAFMNDRNLPKTIQHEILRAFEYRYQHKSVFNETTVLNSVSRTLANKMVAEAYRKTILLLPILKHADITLCGMLCREMRPIHMHQDSIVYEAGRISPGLFMLKSGIVGGFVLLNNVEQTSQTNTDEKNLEMQVLHQSDKGSTKKGTPAKAAKNSEDNENATMKSSTYAVESAKTNEKARRPSFFDNDSARIGRSPTATNEELICVFDEGSHFGHDASMFMPDKKQNSPLQLRVAKSCDLLLVPGRALQNLASFSEKFRTYLEGDAIRLRERLAKGIVEQKSRRTTFVPMYNGYADGTKPEELDEEMDDAHAQTGGSEVRNLVGSGGEVGLMRAGEDHVDPKAKRRISLSIASQASARWQFNAQGELVATEKEEEKNSTLGKANTIKKDATFEALANPVAEMLPDMKKKKRMEKYQCERLVTSLSKEEMEKYVIPEDSKHVNTLETCTSLLRIGFIHPQWGPKIKLDMMIAGLILWSVIVLPYRIAFDDLPEWETAPGAYAFEWFVDFCFAVDIICSFRTCYEGSNLVYVASFSKISNHYLKTWFTIDFFSTIPLDIIIGAIVSISASNAGGSSASDLEALKLIRIVRLVRLIKLARLFKLGKLASSISNYIDSPYLLQLIGLLTMTVFVSHLLGCFWFLISPYNTTDPALTWWGTTMLAASKGDHYLASVYWSFSTMTTVGYGDITPANTSERIYACVAMILGATIFGYVIGNVASMSMQADIAGMRRQEKITNVIGYMKEKMIGASLRRKVENYLDFYFEHCSGFEDTLLNDLPEALQSRVHEFLHGPTVDKFSRTLFRNIRREAATRIISKLRTEVFVRGDVLFRQQEIGDSMYLVEKGVVLCIKGYDRENEKVVRKQIEGSHFGQYSMLKGDIPHPYTAVCSEPAVVLVMSRTNVGIMVEGEAMLGEELEKLFTEQVRFSITKEQRKALTGDDDTVFTVAPRINRILLGMSPQIQRLRAMSGDSTS